MTDEAPQDYGLGRLLIPDERDARYPLRAALRPTDQLEDDDREALERGWRYHHPSGWWGHQGQTPRCVVFMWGHYTEDGPITYPATRHGSDEPPYDMDEAYAWCQRNDQWAGEDYDGTSVRAGAGWLQQLGLIASYVWAQDMDELVHALLTEGPVAVGTWWYRSMFDPDEDGWLTVDGVRDGGHAYLLNGINVREGKVRVKNSWGRGWGDDGHAWLSLSDVERLVFHEAGEACLAVARRIDPR